MSVKGSPSPVFLSWFSSDTQNLFLKHSTPFPSPSGRFIFWKYSLRHSQRNQMVKKERSMIKCCYNPLVLIKSGTRIGSIHTSSRSLQSSRVLSAPHDSIRETACYSSAHSCPSLLINLSKIIPICCSCPWFIHVEKLQGALLLDCATLRPIFVKPAFSDTSGSECFIALKPSFHDRVPDCPH